MSAPTLDEIEIRPSGRGIEKLDFLIADLKTMRGLLDCDGSVSVGLAMAIEDAMLALLDSISPEIRYAEAKFERYRAAPKIGGDL